jgi:DNA-binding NtrC family response regulator
MHHGKVLIVDDDEDVLQAAAMLLKPIASVVLVLSDTDKLMNKISREKYDLILLDMNFSRDTSSGKEGFFWLKNILTFDSNAKVVLMTAYGDVERAVKAMKEGAIDYVLKPWDNDKLFFLAKSILECKTVIPSQKTEPVLETSNFIGVSSQMKKIFATIQKVAPTDANVLVTGENGTGKELVAKELHKHSLRASKAFVSVDMGSLSESVFESELFGHVKGAFTDAREDRIGRIELAQGGTIFLDEIGNLSMAQQAKLLTAIQHKKITPLGSNKVIYIDVRIIAATNAPLKNLIEQQNFRQDLLYRLNTVEIMVPPLRDRKEDIVPLLNYFLDLYCKKYPQTFSKEQVLNMCDELRKHHWPGNVRELRHTVERAVIMGDEHVWNFDTDQQELPAPSIFKLDALEKNSILASLKRHNGNISRTASELGLTRAALYRRMEKYEI